ncbi:WD repeat and FYVE domain-containing protein 2 isoform X3 [Manis javanica]|uniref:WD repeat and FYVE domain-containing protein 2 isoform X3 n=1 Tax=Manis javanica TaxID=9974 RepID=UPI003C6D7849
MVQSQSWPRNDGPDTSYAASAYVQPPLWCKNCLLQPLEFILSEDYNKMTPVKNYQAHQSRVTMLLFVLELEWVLSTGHDKQFVWHCSESGRRLGGRRTGAVASGLQFDVETRHVFIGDHSGQVTILKLEQENCALVTTFRGHTDASFQSRLRVASNPCAGPPEGPLATPASPPPRLPPRHPSLLLLRVRQPVRSADVLQARGAQRSGGACVQPLRLPTVPTGGSVRPLSPRLSPPLAALPPLPVAASEPWTLASVSVQPALPARSPTSPSEVKAPSLSPRSSQPREAEAGQQRRVVASAREAGPGRAGPRSLGVAVGQGLRGLGGVGSTENSGKSGPGGENQHVRGAMMWRRWWESESGGRGWDAGGAPGRAVERLFLWLLAGRRLPCGLMGRSGCAVPRGPRRGQKPPLTARWALSKGFVSAGVVPVRCQCRMLPDPPPSVIILS